ncbi:putative ER membrane protein complex subunit 7 [Helianthus debilis subsp. tardiflorus]
MCQLELTLLKLMSSVIYFHRFFTHLSQVRVDVSARNPGKVQAALTETRRGLNELVLEPLREEQYYEVSLDILVISVASSH